MSETPKEPGLETSAGANAESKGILREQMEFEKKAAQAALDRNDFTALSGIALSLINIERQLKYRDHQD